MHLETEIKAEMFVVEQETVMAAEVQPSFAKRNPEFDGVCMGNRRQCKCGAPFLG
jgi:hypothetical protein